MIGVNKAIIMGNVGADPESRGGDNTVTTFRVATNSQSKAADSGEKVTHTEWHNVVCFGNLAGIARQYIRKGRPIYVEGRIQTNRFEKEGEPTRYYTEIVANNIQFLDSKQASEEV